MRTSKESMMLWILRLFGLALLVSAVFQFVLGVDVWGEIGGPGLIGALNNFSFQSGHDLGFGRDFYDWVIAILSGAIGIFLLIDSFEGDGLRRCKPLFRDRMNQISVGCMGILILLFFPGRWATLWLYFIWNVALWSWPIRRPFQTFSDHAEDLDHRLIRWIRGSAWVLTGFTVEWVFGHLISSFITWGAFFAAEGDELLEALGGKTWADRYKKPIIAVRLAVGAIVAYLAFVTFGPIIVLFILVIVVGVIAYRVLTREERGAERML